MSGQTSGRFLAFEGIDGSGKSTQLQLLLERLRQRGVECRGTREPSDGPVGAMLRQILTGRMAADSRVIAGLFAADRLDHLVNERDGILEQVRSGATVVTDRYYFSSYAYHGVDVDMGWVIDSNRLSAELLRPDATIFLDVPVRRALERIGRNRTHTELFEKEDRLTATREKYLEAFARLRDTETVLTVDADADADTVAERIWAAVSHLFP
ncbi:dTMP kinase [Oscillibacter sp. 1-3]|uniref:dTMP kinase n=1 Tax=Oscillibacter sp. 1-3 TaxID=1235797 RepID=UPI000339EA57|nr:dTMP kinase [Oscillibacter sp. 1-3]EOS66140.1 thymidylate kinase [Oscillibacter sp. 1-3]